MNEYFPPPCVFLVDVDQGLFLNPRTLRIGLPVQEHPRVRLGSVVTLKYTFVRAGESVPIPEGAEIVADLMDRDPALAPRPFYSAPGLRLEEETGSVLVSYDLSSPNMAAMAAGPVWFSVRVNGSNCLTDRGTMETGSWSYPMPATPFQETEVSIDAGGTIALRPTPTLYTTDPVGADEPERVVPISAAALAEDTFYDCNRLLIKVLGENGTTLTFTGADRVDGVVWKDGWWICKIRQYPDNAVGVEISAAGTGGPTDIADFSDMTGILTAKENVANKTQAIDAVTPSADKYTSEAAVVAHVAAAVTDAMGDIEAALDALIGGA